MKVSELGLGDIVQVFEGPYGTATVYRKDGLDAHVWRPYVTTAGFSYTGGVIPYIGLEDFVLIGSTDIKRLRKGDDLA